MAQLTKVKPQNSFKVIFVEKADTFGPGFPYCDQVVLPEHLVNIPSGCIDITKTDIRYSEMSDFLKWTESLDQERRISYGMSKSDWGPNSVPPRYVVGEYLKQRFNEFHEQALENGINISLFSGCTAVSIEKSNIDENMAVVSLSDGQQFSAPDVALVTGHWQRSRFETEGYFDSPWPAKRLLDSIPPRHIAIIGSSLSVIDATLTFRPTSEYTKSRRLEKSRTSETPALTPSK